MLDNETKRRIDTCRDILVGKVPDPKSQVEQISIALIYKFMDDMDREAVDMGGKAGFFTGEYEKYAWSKIFDPRLGGFDMLALYSESITRMSQNPGIPQLFRDIFKNAYLPYRDPETLKLFLKSINEFTYDHSERLGDAFEYLLSVLGSQGDAGQFRTPRHIIDFMVEVMKPQKHETILDPACGTAGFLVSSYKHILRANTKKIPGDQLKAEERKKLLTNFKGYDISPDMVRLSLVNLYLHGFVQPQVMEYDTLTSEDRWNEYADVILANPPFMSPKGGIKPHKKFSVQSNRSEVLFVDYIAEHLTPIGRAAVIVPEGIIFQSANAYKQLRKYLVDEGYIYAVVSLPAGVFNPYSGVKTSILLMDKTIAKKANGILFIKVDNDGFGLGAQRRAVENSDLPGALDLINGYVEAMRSGKTFDSDKLDGNAILVAKEALAENGEYNLTGERHRVSEKKVQQKWPMVKLEDLCEILDRLRKPVEKSERKKGQYPYYGATGIVDYVDDYIFDEKLVLVGEDGAKWGEGEKTAFIVDGKCWVNNHAHVLRPDRARVFDELIVYLLNNIDLSSYITGVTVPKLNQEKLRSIKIPLPTLDVQREIVAEIEGYQKIIDGARQVVDNWKPQIDIDPDWPMVKLGEVCEIFGGGTPSRSNESYWGGSIPWISSKYFSDEHTITGYEAITEEGLKNSSSRIAPKGSTILITRVSVGKFAIADKDYAINQDLTALVSKNNNLDAQYLWLITELVANNTKKNATGIGVVGVTRDFIVNQEIPLPGLDIQHSIVNKIGSERSVVNGCRELIKIYEDKIKQVIDKVWED